MTVRPHDPQLSCIGCSTGCDRGETLARLGLALFSLVSLTVFQILSGLMPTDEPIMGHGVG